MIPLPQPHFLNPTKAFRRLSILLAIIHGNRPSQRTLARDTNLSSSMVNSYIKDLTKEGLLQISNRNNRDFNYGITSKGKKEATSLLLGYSAEIIKFYSLTKHEIAARLKNIFAKVKNAKLVLFGASETCELVFHALEQFHQVHVIGIADSDPAKQHQLFHNYAVISPEAIPALKPDYILITSFAKQDEIHQSISHYNDRGITIIKLSTL